MAVDLYTADVEYISNIYLYFYSTPQYRIYPCRSSDIYFLADLPADQDKIWTISKTATAVMMFWLWTCSIMSIPLAV